MIDWLGTWENPVVETVDVIDAGESVISVFRWTGRGKASGVETETTMFGVYDFEAGRIVRFRQYDTRKEALEAARAAGVGRQLHFLSLLGPPRRSLDAARFHWFRMRASSSSTSSPVNGLARSARSSAVAAVTDPFRACSERMRRVSSRVRISWSPATFPFCHLPLLMDESPRLK